jgi:hypothetical protein
MVKRLVGLSCALLVTASGFLGCKETPPVSDNMPTNGKNLQLVYPKGGETLHLGDTVVIQFKVNADKVLQTDPSLSINNGMSFSDIAFKSVESDLVAGGGQLLEYTWIIGEEVNPVDFTNLPLTQCKIKIKDYDPKASPDVSNDVSGTFTIAQK